MSTTIADLKTKIKNANALGRQNLTEKGVEIPETATTYEIMSKIADVSSGIEAIDHTVTFTVDGEPYEVVSVKNGNSVNAPTTPTKAGSVFSGWKNAEGEFVGFPHTPTKTEELLAEYIQKYSDTLYSYFGVDRTECPYIIITYFNSSAILEVYFATQIMSSYGNYLYKLDGRGKDFSSYFNDFDNVGTIINGITTLFSPNEMQVKTTPTKYSFSDTWDYWFNDTSVSPSKVKSKRYFN